MDGKLINLTAQVLAATGCVLGESPFWHKERQSCFWVDIEVCRIYEYSFLEKTIHYYQLQQLVSLIVKGKGDHLIVGLQGGVGRFNLKTQELVMITDLNENWKTHRCNDGICDSKGRLWISTMELKDDKENGSVYCVGNGSFDKRMSNVAISNGMAWSLDNTRLYHIDSVTRKVCSYLYEEQSGNITLEKVVVNTPEHLGLPDGMTIDAEGMLWIAFWGGNGVGRFDPDSGLMIGFIEIPAPLVTSCTFAGAELDQMIITTARENLTPKVLEDFPESGNTFIVTPGIKGIPDFICEL